MLRCTDIIRQFLSNVIGSFAAITYKVVVKTGKQLGGSTTTAQAWMTLAGNITDTGVMKIPKNENEFRFKVTLRK